VYNNRFSRIGKKKKEKRGKNKAERCSSAFRKSPRMDVHHHADLFLRRILRLFLLLSLFFPQFFSIDALRYSQIRFRLKINKRPLNKRIMYRFGIKARVADELGARTTRQYRGISRNSGPRMKNKRRRRVQHNASLCYCEWNLLWHLIQAPSYNLSSWRTGRSPTPSR